VVNQASSWVNLLQKKSGFCGPSKCKCRRVSDRTHHVGVSRGIKVGVSQSVIHRLILEYWLGAPIAGGGVGLDDLETTQGAGSI